MRYLILAVFTDGVTQTRIMDLGFFSPDEKVEGIIEGITNTPGFVKNSLREVFVYKSAINYGDAPIQEAHWKADNGFFGVEDDDDDESPREED